ncbi:MAG: tyrosine-type recombinase/integrase [Clostridium sp.]|uniref:tyrosine-type recombinase/integrase n=1 Tax=Clostridium sp. TaxID=1506 RepID=UPI0039EA6893
MRRKTKIITEDNVTFKQGFLMFLDNCKAKNLRPATIEHYKQGYKSIVRFFDEDTLIKDITQETVDNYVIACKDNLNLASQTLHTYVRDFKTILYYFMKLEYMQPFKIQLPRVDKKAIETYSDKELEILLKKPNTKKCHFAEYRDYVIINFILSTAVRINSLINIKEKDVDFENNVVYVNTTKNRKPLIIPLNKTIVKILREYIRIREADSEDDYLFCTVYNNKMDRRTVNGSLNIYNRKRNVNKIGVHRLRHTAAKKWILAGKSPSILQHLLGHSSLVITQNYINILVSDLKKEVDNFDILEEFNSSNHIKMKSKK